MFKRKLSTLIFTLYISALLGSLSAAKPIDPCFTLSANQQKLLTTGYCRTASKQYVPIDVVRIIWHNVYTLPLNCTGYDYIGRNFTGYNLKNRNFTNANLRGVNLTKADLTGCIFKNTILTDTNLQGVTLTNTQCDYLGLFQGNLIANRQGGMWYQNNLPNDIRSIEKIYSLIESHQYKANLLHTACGLAQLPFYGSAEFYIKVQYWSCKLLLFKQSLDKKLANQLVCSLQLDLENDTKDYCWQTDYKGDQPIQADITHAKQSNFDGYIQAFEAGLKKYNVKSKNDYGYNYYKEQISTCIQGLQKAYLKLKSTTLQKEAIEIADLLSQSYKTQHWCFLLHYLSLQNRLIQFKKSAGEGVQNEIYYSFTFR